MKARLAELQKESTDKDKVRVGDIGHIGQSI